MDKVYSILGEGGIDFDFFYKFGRVGKADKINSLKNLKVRFN